MRDGLKWGDEDGVGMRDEGVRVGDGVGITINNISFARG